MNSLIIKTASRFLILIVIIFSIYSLVRGHNAPGGGFIGGLLLTGAYALFGLSHGKKELLKILPFDLKSIMAVGVLTAFLSGLIGLVLGGDFLQVKWIGVSVPGIGKLGSALLFDIGVYISVFSASLLIIFSLSED